MAVDFLGRTAKIGNNYTPTGGKIAQSKRWGKLNFLRGIL